MPSPVWRHRSRVVEALLLVSLGGLLQRLVPMSRWSSLLGTPQPVPMTWRGRPLDALPTRPATVRERHVALAVRRASRRLPWEPSCLAEAFAGQLMLRTRGEPGVVVIGLRRRVDAGGWDTHAWLLGRDGALAGGPAAEGYTPTAVFSPVEGWTAALDVR